MKTIGFLKAKKNLATLWFVFFVVMFLIMSFQTMYGKFEDKIQIAWGWFLPSILPTLTLMIGVFAVDIRNAKPNEDMIDRFYYRIASYTSSMYLLSMFLIIIIQPLTKNNIIEIMQNSSVFLGPFQGLISLFIGLFFLKKD